MVELFDLLLSKQADCPPLVSQFLVELPDDTALGLNDDVSSFDLIIVRLFQSSDLTEWPGLLVTSYSKYTRSSSQWSEQSQLMFSNLI